MELVIIISILIAVIWGMLNFWLENEKFGFRSATL